MANIKIYKSKAGITRRLKITGNMGLSKTVRERIGLLIEIDDRVVAVDRTINWLEKQTPELKPIVPITKLDLELIEKYLGEVAAERDYLKRLYVNTRGPQWTSHKNWNTSASLTKWEGLWLKKAPYIIKDRVVIIANRVYKIDLNHHNLYGHNSTGVQGNLPDDIEKLACLEYLDLGRNCISHALPSTLGNLRKLKKLHLHFNHFYKGLPKFDHLDSLEELWLNHNHLEGGIEELTKLKKLKNCHIYHTKFSGEIPVALAEKKDLTEFKFYSTYLQYGEEVQERIDNEPGWEGHKPSEKPAHLVYD